MKTPSGLDYVERLLLPGLSLAALVLAELKGNSSDLRWALLGLTVFFVLVGFYSPVKSKAQQWLQDRTDKRVTVDALPELRRLSRSFAEFVDTGRQDTLHWIIDSELCQGNAESLAKLPIPQLSLWYGLSQYFLVRVARQTPKVSELRSSLMEFQHLVASYNNMCVAPVFERLPQDLQTALTPKVRGSLNLFQQRFGSFLKEYEDFVKGLGESRQAFHGLPYSFVRPKPL